MYNMKSAIKIFYFLTEWSERFYLRLIIWGQICLLILSLFWVLFNGYTFVLYIRGIEIWRLRYLQKQLILKYIILYTPTPLVFPGHLFYVKTFNISKIDTETVRQNITTITVVLYRNVSRVPFGVYTVFRTTMIHRRFQMYNKYYMRTPRRRRGASEANRLTGFICTASAVYPIGNFWIITLLLFNRTSKMLI